MNEQLLKIDIELRSLSDKIKDGSIKGEEAKAQLETLKTQKRELEQKIAQANAPVDEKRTAVADIQKAMIEKRAITLSGTGAINQIKELAKELSQKKEILKLVRYFYGANASTNIPVWSPTLATPGNFAEGAKGIANDDQAALGNKTITPYAYVSILPISAEALTLGTVNFDAELPEIFGDAFADAFAKGVVNGDGAGRNINGLFNINEKTKKVECASAGNPKVADLVNLALKVRDFTDDAVIVMNSAIYSLIQADDTAGVAQLYKEELIRTKTIEGVPVLLTGYAPSVTDSGEPVAVAGRMSDYGFGLASEITIEPIKQLGDTNTYFQATVFGNGTKILENNFFALVTK